MVWSTFYDTVLNYWHAAKLYVQDEQSRNALISQDLGRLYDELVVIGKANGKFFSDSDIAPSPDDVKDFLEGERRGE